MRLAFEKSIPRKCKLSDLLLQLEPLATNDGPRADVDISSQKCLQIWDVQDGGQV